MIKLFREHKENDHTAPELFDWLNVTQYSAVRLEIIKGVLGIGLNVGVE